MRAVADARATSCSARTRGSLARARGWRWRAEATLRCAFERAIARRSCRLFALHGCLPQGLEEYDTYLGISSIVTELKWGKSACGHPGIVHGGALAASFDDAFGALFFSRRVGNGFTARLEIDYKRPVPAGTPLRLVSEVDSIEGRKVWMKATLQSRAAQGEAPVVYARSRCLFIVARVPKPEELHAKPEDAPQR